MVLSVPVDLAGDRAAGELGLHDYAPSLEDGEDLKRNVVLARNWIAYLLTVMYYPQQPA